MSKIEKFGLEKLTDFLRNKGKTVERLIKNTFDLKIDNQFAEVKCKNKPFRDIDFISLTKNQQNRVNENYLIYIVTNLKDPKNIEIHRFISADLKKIKYNQIISYEYNRGELKKLNLKKLS